VPSARHEGGHMIVAMDAGRGLLWRDPARNDPLKPSKSLKTQNLIVLNGLHCLLVTAVH
jgi:hypothetical protein